MPVIFCVPIAIAPLIVPPALGRALLAVVVVLVNTASLAETSIPSTVPVIVILPLNVPFLASISLAYKSLQRRLPLPKSFVVVTLGTRLLSNLAVIVKVSLLLSPKSVFPLTVRFPVSI